MGSIINLKCPNCGYQNNVQEGVGMNGINLTIIKHIFSAEELSDFLQKLEEGKIYNYQMFSQIGYCEKCNAIHSVSIIHFTDNNGNKTEIKKNCPSCNTPLSFSDKKNLCPNCSTLLERTEIGLWD